MIALVGAIGGLFRKRRKMPWDIIFVFALALTFAWGMAFARSFGFTILYNWYVPVARHALPAIIPTALFLTFGWLEVFRWLVAAWVWLRLKLKPSSVLPQDGKLVGSQYSMMLVYSIPWIVLDIVSLASILVFYR